MERGDGGTCLGEGGRATLGLTDEQVAQRVRAGQVNANADVKTKSVWQILREHTFTLFNAVNVAMAALVVSTGSYKNVAFMAVVASNLVIGVFQEIRAKRKVDRLSILTSKDVCVLRAGEKRHVPVSAVVRDDVVLLAHGDQVPADGVVLRGSPRMDESLLTGESNAIEKSVGDEVLSGSFVDSGAFAYRVTRVGRDAYAAKLNAEAKYVKRVRSEILYTLSAIIRLGTIALIPLGAGLFVRINLMGRYGYDDAVLQTVAAVVGMIPQGLVLLTSSVLAIATTRLASKSVLVQQSYCVETLARVDVLCLDKTGTITTGAMEVAEVRGDAARAAVTIAAANEADANETARAILEYGRARGVEALAVTRAVPFSSRTKCSGCVTADGTALVMGAAQFVMGAAFGQVEDEVRSFPGLMRVLVVARVDGFARDGSAVGTPRVLGFLGIRDQIRPTAAQTMRYFREQGVDIRVISGDDPRTASSIAAAVGVPGAERCVDASTLKTDADVAAAVEKCRVFGRVTPHMKRRLVRTLREAGHVVAMTGDGVNDVLALKDADCSVAMASGSAAARNVAEIVLADNDFAHLPEVVAEGRRSINNLQRSASLFLMKTVYSAVLALVCIVLPPYPFIPVQMSLVSTAIIGAPSFLLALEPNHERVRGRFLTNVLSRSLPASFAIILAIVASIAASKLMGWSDGVMSTVCMFQMFAVGIALIYRISRPLNPMRVGVICVVVAIVVAGTTAGAGFFSVVSPTFNSAATSVAIAAVAIVLFNRLYDESVAEAGPRGLVGFLIRKLEALDDSE
ncbi:HAD-IC family P-type ATPase [Parafannyhessea umbonata]|uniref:HAD-IC family P-type ATPase n=1 Tax=Parafannyhessea umbonata TaxID=604330 RepID=UPI00359C3003